MNKFKMGDRVRIKALYSKEKRMEMCGHIGHEGEIVSITTNGFYELEPYCKGGSWPSDCLELIDNNIQYEIY